MENRQPRNLLSLLGWRPGRLARNSGALLGWMLLRAGSQAAIVLLLARTLGAADYGKFVAIIAIASFVLPFVGLGLSNIVLRNGAKDPAHLPFYMGRAVRWWWLSVLPSVALAYLIALLLLPAGLPHMAIFAAIAAELIATSLTELSARYHQAEHRMNAFGAINAGLPMMRLIALLLLFITIGVHHVEPVLWAYAGGSMVYAICQWTSIRTNHLIHGGVHPMPVRSGLSFSMAGLTMRLQAEFNKPMLAHLGFNLAGAYNIAQRANDLASMPLLALQESMWPRLYSHEEPQHQLRRTGALLLLLSIACSAGIWLTAPLLPRVLGSDFTGSASTMRNLALLPLVQSFRALLNFKAIHHGQMKLIGWASAMGAVLGVAGVAAFVPTHGIIGAVVASYAAEVAMITFLAAGTSRTTR